MISLEVVKSSHDKYSWSDTLLEDVYNVILSHNDYDEFNLYKIISKPVCIFKVQITNLSSKIPTFYLEQHFNFLFILNYCIFILEVSQHYVQSLQYTNSYSLCKLYYSV